MRSRHVVVGAWNTARTSAPARSSHAVSSSVSLVGCRSRWAARLASACRCAARASSKRTLEGPGDETILGLDGVELATRPLGFEAGPLDGQLEDRDMPAVVGVGLGQRLGRRRQAGRLEHGEDLFEHAVLEPAPAEALAAPFAAIELLVAAAEIAAACCRSCRSSRPASSARSVRSGSGPAAGPSLHAPHRPRGRAGARQLARSSSWVRS